MPDAVRFRPLLDFIAYHEGTANQPGGGYETSLAYGRYLPGGHETTLTTQNLAQIDSLQTFMLKNPANKFNSSALGRYQIVQTTLRNLKRIYRIPDSDLFSPSNQDYFGAALIEGRGRNVIGLAQEWASLASVSPAEILRAYDQDGRVGPHMPTFAEVSSESIENTSTDHAYDRVLANLVDTGSDADCIPELIKIGRDPTKITEIQALATKTMAQLRPPIKYPTKSCAATLSHFLRAAGVKIPITVGAQDLADRLRLNRKWIRKAVGDQQPGDVAVCYSRSNDVPGADHIFLVVSIKGSDLMEIADNQVQGRTHSRYASGKGRTPVEYFLQAPMHNLMMLISEEQVEVDVGDEPTNDLSEPYMDNGEPRLMNEDGSPIIID